MYTAARQFKVDSKRIREWCSQKERLLALLREEREKGLSERKRLNGGGRKMMDENMEEALFQWIVYMSNQNFRVSREMIKNKAKKLSTVPNFKASQGWLQRFMKRKGVAIHQSRHCPYAEYLPTPELIEDFTFMQAIAHGYNGHPQVMQHNGHPQVMQHNLC